MTTENQAQAAQEKLSAKFKRVSEKTPLPVVETKLGHDTDGHFLNVVLSRNPTLSERRYLPDDVDGVRVKYSSNRRIRIRM
jgi:hypothetical protein